MFKTIDENNSYAVSSIGEILNKKTNEIKKLRLHNGYPLVGLWFKGKKKWFFVHRLVANAFIPIKNNKCFVNHKDGNKLNNHYSNLEWVDKSENALHAIRIGLCNPYEKNNKPIQQFSLDGVLIKEWISARMAEKSLGYANGVISKVLLKHKGRNTTGGYKWEFSNP